MNSLNFIYNNQTVDFLPTCKDNVMVNATQMAKIFGKKVEAFVRNDDTKNFISEALKSENSRFLNIENESDLIDSKQKSGTWMHRILALKFAAWLDPAFELWVYITIDQILFSNYRDQKEATIQKLQAENDLAKKRHELLEKNPEFIEFLELENKVNEADKKRIKAIRASVNQLKLDFFPSLT